MKILIGVLLIGALGAGSFLFANSPATPAASAAPSQACHATVTCTPEGTCVMHCELPDGQTCTTPLPCCPANCPQR